MFPLNETEQNLTIKLSTNEEKTFPYFYFLNYTMDGFPREPEKIEYEWNYSTKEFRCRVDETNKLNVFYQNDFEFYDLETNEMLDIIYNCTKLFHSNNYKIVGIESKNEGGLIILATYLQQLLQPKICKNQIPTAIRNNTYLESVFKIYPNLLDIKTCRPFKSFKDMLEHKPDNYGDNITHYRTKIIDLINLEDKADLYKKRKEFIETKNTKKPTDIIIFTDYYSISATSIFLKGLQQTGGAIIVGYFGNPKIKNVTRDSSINYSGAFLYSHIIPFINLNESGLMTHGPSFEFYSYDYQQNNPIPLEYISYPVDEHVNIYEPYSDSIYEKFIKEANRIFKKYENECNKDNKLLLLEDNKCYYIEDDNHAHGGYVCGDNGKWNKSKCQAFYCDLGYYYDTYQKKCIEDICIKSDDDNDDNNSWIFIAIIVGVSLLIILSKIINFITRKKRKSKESTEKNENDRLMESNNNSVA